MSLVCVCGGGGDMCLGLSLSITAGLIVGGKM